MTIDRIIMAVAGIMIILSVVFAQFVSPYWLILSAFVGANMFQASMTGFCPLAIMLKQIGIRPGAAF